MDVARTHKYGGWDMSGEEYGFPHEESIYNRPISSKENFDLMFSGKTPCWMPLIGWGFCDVNIFRPRMNPDNVVTHIIFDGEAPYEYSGLVMHSSWFDLDWEYEPNIGGATVRPGSPKVPDITRWEDYVSMPDLDVLDWDGCVDRNQEYLDTPQMNQLGILDGFWERLMSLMGVEDAAISLIDEDQQEGVRRFFDEYADFLIDYIGRMKDRLPIDCVLIHDDWGHQRGTFFSIDTAMEMLVPYLRRVTDYVHSRGMHFELHSCGKNQTLVPAYVVAGVDMWSAQDMNDLVWMSQEYKDLPLFIGDQAIGFLPPELTDDEVRQAAREWFEKFKGTKILPDFMSADGVFANEIYRLSREYCLAR